MKTYNISKYSCEKLQSDKKYRKQAVKELSESLQEVPNKFNSFTFYWRGKVLQMDECAIMSGVICELVGAEIYDLNIRSKLSDFTYSYLVID